MGTFKNVLDKLNTAIKYISIVMLVLMTFIMFFQVITRYIFSWTPKWSEELSLFLMTWFGFLGMAVGVKEDWHISMGFLYNFFGKGMRNVIDIFDDIVVLLIGLFMIVYGYKLVIATMGSYIASLQIPSGVQYSIVPISGVVILLYSIYRILNRIGGES